MPNLYYEWSDPDTDELFDCQLDCSPEEKQTYWEPGCPEEYSLTSMEFKGVELYHLLNKATIDHIELSAQEYYEDRKNEDFQEPDPCFEDVPY